MNRNEIEVGLSDREVFDAIKEKSSAPERMRNDTGALNLTWEAAEQMLSQEDNRPPPTRIKSAVNPEKQMGAVVVTKDKQQHYAPMYKSDPNAEREQKKVTARLVDPFSEREIIQITQARMKGNSNIHLYLDKSLPKAYQLISPSFAKDVLVVAPRGLAWELGRFSWIIEDMKSENGWAIGGKSSYDIVIEKFINHLTSGK